MGQSTFHGMVEGQISQSAANRVYAINYFRCSDSWPFNCANCIHGFKRDRNRFCALHTIRVHVDGACGHHKDKL